MCHPWLRSVGHRVKIHKVTPAAVNDFGDVEIKDYVVLPHGEDNRLPPHPLLLDVTMTHDLLKHLYGRTTLIPAENTLHTISSNDVPQSDGTLTNTVRKKMLHYRQFYSDLFDPIVFMSVTVNMGHLHDGFLRLFFFHAHRETITLAGELPEESD